MGFAINKFLIFFKLNIYMFIPKSNRKIVERVKIDSPNTHIHTII
jgi:hypothetical protein